MAKETFKILICDDSILVRKKLKEALSLCSTFEFLEAGDGQTAVDIYKKEKPDLVFMDLVIPVKDGITAVKEIKEFDDDALVVIASSSGTQENLKKAIKAGAVEFIQKPWEQEQLENVVKKFLKKGE
ncbi:MAG TPA: response regulator [Defluviitaleaceae bacterium]|nr:response regulator [Candidatus Epulonipiscium sp.]HOA80000.1 response regulator [Defluviitaleaceae bacterium]